MYIYIYIILVKSYTVEAEESEVWYKAKVVRILSETNEFQIHYLGWKKKWDKEKGLILKSKIS